MLSRFLFNFFSSFVILMFIFIFQTIWLFIDDLAGKGLDIIIIGKFLFYLMPNLTEKVLPLTVLLSSILTFGTLAENYEFAAMKASGISLQRAMLSLIVFIVFLGGITFYFANSVIPASEQKIYNLRRNIAKVKPAVAIVEGVFSDFEGADMNIKVDRKYGENDRFLENVTIHLKTKTKVNSTVIKAKTGELKSSESSDILQLVLYDGHYYRDLEKSTTKGKNKYPFANANFDTYTMNIDLSEFNNVDMEEERDVSTEKMKNVSRLTKDIDSLKKDNLRIVGAFSKNIQTRVGAFAGFRKDSLKPITKEEIEEKYSKVKKIKKDTIAKDSIRSIADIINLYPDWQKIQLMSAAKTNSSNLLTSIQGKKNELSKRYEIYNRHILSLHKKFALALSCVILFFVGAPLGAIIRKGGIGLPMVIAIILFLTYYFIGVFAENYAKKNEIHPIIGAWLSTMIMLPLSIVLTKRATADRGLMNLDGFVEFFQKLFKKK
ncbi:LptF/LptG family permease [Maribacter sp. TH_r10]|uniref:LptF/LptG family permease n=1 Tax=Maribacter TaxID=252356 RepID=UPI002493B7BF|nr:MULTISPECIES: LptF/LptG family permease [Maribacter]MDV7139043.1 LptF/LptG family permease [Maribacter sp. TH_r10]